MKTRIAFWCAAASLSLPTYADTVFSWETGNQGWQNNGNGSITTSSALGVTDGDNSLAITTPMSDMWYSTPTQIYPDQSTRQALFTGATAIKMDITYPDPGYNSWFVTPKVELIIQGDGVNWSPLGELSLSVGNTPQTLTLNLTTAQASALANGGWANLVLKFVYGNGGTSSSNAVFYVDKLSAVTPPPPPPPSGDYFWNGTTNGDWTADNWTADIDGTTPAPLLTTDGTKAVEFATGSGLDSTTTLGANQSIVSLSFNGSSGSTTIGGTHDLTLGTGGIFGDYGSGPVVINTTGQIVLGTDQTWANSGTEMTISSVVSGAYKLTTAGTGTTVLTAANTYTGGTVVQQGTLKMGNAAALGPVTNTLALDGGTLDVNGFDLSVKNLSGLLGNIRNSASGTATLTAQCNTTTTFAGGMNDGGSGNILAFVKNGAGTLDLGGKGSYTGNVQINQGTVIARTALFESPFTSNFGNLQTGGRTISVASGATLRFTSNNILGGGGSNFSLLPTITLTGSTLQSTRYNALGAMVLQGATVTQSASDSGSYEGYQFKGDFTISGSAASVISTTNGKGNHLSTNTQFDVADATGDGEVDLTVSAPLLDQSGDFGLAAGGFTKTGAGTLLLSGASRFTGTAFVSAGILRSSGTFSDRSTVNVATSGATLDLDFTGSDTVGTFSIGGVSQGLGQFGAIGSGAQHEVAQITGSGLIFVDPFALWIQSYPALTGADATRTADPDHDGQSNLMEYALDSDPGTSSVSGKVRSGVETVSGQQALVITLPVLSGAVFAGDSPAIASLPGQRLAYRIEGSNELQSFDQQVSEISPSTSGLPALDSGWTYRTFRLNGPISGVNSRGPTGFLRAVIAETP